MHRIALLALTLLVALPGRAFEIRVHPGREIYLYEVDARRGLSTALVQNLALVQGEGAAVTAEELTVDLTAAGRVRQSVHFDADDLGKAAARMAAVKAAGMLELYDFAFQLQRYLGEKTGLASTTTISPGNALVVTSIPLLVPRGVDSMRITAKAKAEDGSPVVATLELPLRFYEQANEYRFPLRGAWVAAVGGVVVVVVGDQEESNERLRQPGEAGEAFMKRTMEEQAKLLAKGAPGVAGNFVVVRHAGGEHSHYVHLAAGSVVVKQGDSVKQGQPLGRLGHTGNSTEPHLHFNVADGPDPLYSRSLPVRFSGLTTADGPLPPSYVQSGWLVKAE